MQKPRPPRPTLCLIRTNALHYTPFLSPDFIAVEQLLLDINDNDSAYPQFDKLLGSANAELIFRLQHKHDPFLYLWGTPGAGKSHILQAWVGQALARGESAIYLNPACQNITEHAERYRFIAIDQIHTLNPTEQAQLFYLFNTIRNSGQGYLLLAADTPPTQLMLREDLQTRLASCLIYEVKPLNCEEKIEALTQLAKTRQLNIDPNIYHYLIHNWRADLQSLLNMFNDLANYSVTRHQPITLTQLKKLLNQQDAP